MQGIFEFIIQVENPFQDTIETKSGHKFYVDPDLDRVKFSNRLGKVISVPIAVETPIEEGDEVIIVQTVLMPHITQYGRSDSPFLVDKEKGYYRLDSSLIVMYKNKTGEWFCNGDNVMLIPVDKTTEPTVSGLIIPTTKKEYANYAIVKYLNKKLEGQGVKQGDAVYIKPEGNYVFEVDDEKLWRMTNDHIIAIKEDCYAG